MCEARVYLVDESGEHEILRDVVLVRPRDEGFLLVTLLGEQKVVQGTIVEIDLLKHIVRLRPGNPEGRGDQAS
ncbi:MAG: CooT family nickel-binding protein [Anaerolineae bacterium]